MPISIKNPETEELARQLAEETGETITEVIKKSLQDRLQRVRGRRHARGLPEQVADILQRGFEMLANTAQFDCTHHPAMSLPCGMVDGLPVGMMLVGKAFDEETIYRAAAAFESRVDWKSLKAG